MSDVAPMKCHQPSKKKCMIAPAFHTGNGTIDLPMAVGTVRLGMGHSSCFATQPFSG
jgi:hypothetical protein